MKSKFLKYIVILILLAALFYGAYYIYQSNQKVEEAAPTIVEEAVVTEKKSLRIGIANYDNINPLLSWNKEVLQIANLVFEPLVTITEDYKLQMCLAKEVSKLDSMTYVIKIDNQTKWHDNTPLVAKDIQFTIDKLKEGNSVYSYNVEAISSVEIVDSSTVKIYLSHPVSYFEYNLTFPIVSHSQFFEEDMATSLKTPVGTGRFKIASLNSSGMEFSRNESYRIEEKSNLDTITIYFYSSMGEVYNSFKVGNIDFFGTKNREIETYIGTMGYVKKEFKGREFDFLMMNQENLALDCVEVRQAIQYAIDKDNILSSVLNNEGYVSEFPLDYGCYLYPENAIKSEYDTEKAKLTLVNGGWEYKNNRWQKIIDGYNVKLDFDLVVWKDNGERLKTAEIIKEQLEAIGIKVTLRKVNNDQYNAYLQNKNYDLMVSGVYNSYSPELEYFIGSGNISNYYNMEVITLLSEMENITDQKLLQEKMNRVIEIYKNEVPFIGLYRNQSQVIYTTNLLGDIKPNNYSYFHYINGWVRK